MIAVIQRVTHARVMIEGEVVALIDKGLLILLGVEKGDGAKEIKYLAEKIVSRP